MTATVAGLRAFCPSCGVAVAVRCRNREWRMVDHRRETLDGKEPCRVRDIDAKPLVRVWIDDHRRSAEGHAREAARIREQSEALLVKAADRDEFSRQLTKQADAMLALLESAR